MAKTKIIFILVAFLLTASSSLAADFSKDNVQVKEVIDGDTIVVEMNGKLETVRLLGINTEELQSGNLRKQCLAKQAKEYVTKLLKYQFVYIQTDIISNNRDEYGRLLRYVHYNDRDMSYNLLKDGMAETYDKFLIDEGKKAEYDSAASYAKEHKLNMYDEYICNYSSDMAERTAGRLLLRVEKGGEIWYVDPEFKNRHAVTFANALPLFERFAIGISNEDLLKIRADGSSLRPDLDSDSDGYGDGVELNAGFNPYVPGEAWLFYDRALSGRLAGKFLLQVEDGGAIWYVDMDGIRHNVRWDNLMSLFEKLALGISESDIEKISVE